MKTWDVIVVGGGAAGLMAGGQAAACGADVLILEKMKRPARKLCITGKGRCNLTNNAELRDFIGHFGPRGRFLHQAFNRFFSAELISFFNDKGLQLTHERGGRVFPVDGKAVAILETFEKWLNQMGVRLDCGVRVDKILADTSGVKGVRGSGQVYHCKKLILTTGGSSYPRTGSTGDGYRFAGQLGHTITPIRPALVPLLTDLGLCRDLAGLELRNIDVGLLVDGKKKGKWFGEIAFFENRLAGPVVLTLSGQVVELLRDGRQVELALDLKPALDEKKLDARLLRDFQKRHRETLESVLGGLLPAKLIPVCLKETELNADQQAGTIRSKQRRRLRLWLKDFKIPIPGHRPMAEAIVTAGGVDLSEVNPKTMESKLVDGLHLAGEILDLHGDTGGYNLQAAFSTGWLAGQCAAQDHDRGDLSSSP
ncbi:MAG: NAD(P)/FAD-dependent oxidoreductase [Thermodesulfobacteriota bacterium]